MSESRLYTLDEVTERLLLTDAELLLCKQHREYGEKLDDMLNDKTESVGEHIIKPPDEA